MVSRSSKNEWASTPFSYFCRNIRISGRSRIPTYAKKKFRISNIPAQSSCSKVVKSLGDIGSGGRSDTSGSFLRRPNKESLGIAADAEMDRIIGGATVLLVLPLALPLAYELLTDLTSGGKGSAAIGCGANATNGKNTATPKSANLHQNRPSSIPHITFAGFTSRCTILCS